MATEISKTQDLKMLRQVLHQSIDELLLELESHGQKGPSLEQLDPDVLLAPPVGDRPRRQIARACEKMTALVLGPMGVCDTSLVRILQQFLDGRDVVPPVLTIEILQWMMQSTGGYTFPAALNTALELKLHHLVSKDPTKPTTLADLAHHSGGSEELISRLLRFLTQQYVFREVEPGCYVHNANSIIMQLPTVEALMGLCSDDIFRAAGAFSSTMKENKFQVDEGKSAFSKAFQTDLESFDYLYQEEPERGRRFSLGMTPFTGSYASSLALYPFNDLPSGALVVDVGGGSGHVSNAIAKANPHLKFVVQDLEEPIRLGKSIHENSGLPVEWQVHNMLHPQPVKGADVYFMRRVLHDHSDPVATKILRLIVDAMGKTSRILIEDMIAPDSYGEDSEWFTNHADLVMLMMHNAKERTHVQWQSLIESTDERLGIVKTWKGNGDRGGSAIIEVMLR